MARATETSARTVVAQLDATRPARADRETFCGYGVLGLPFDSGHVLGLRCWSSSSIGPPYHSVWHRSPDGEWSFWSTAAPELSCTRYTGELSDDTRRSDVTVEWPAPNRLVVRSTTPALEWDLTVGASPMSKLLGASARRLSDGLLERDAALRALGPLAGRLLGVGTLVMTGRMPNGQRFRLVPSHVWHVTASHATLDGVDLGVPARLREQAALGDFRVPQRGIFAVGSADFEPFDEARHSTRTSRAS
jgi:hypothetical protein